MQIWTSRFASLHLALIFLLLAYKSSVLQKLGQMRLNLNPPCIRKQGSAHATELGSLGQSYLAGSRSEREGVLQEVMGRALCGASPELLRDLSVHVCFICLLHLANENSLRISGVPSLDRLTANNVTLTAS